MSRISFVLLALLSFSHIAYAEGISPEKAKSKAVRFLSSLAERDGRRKAPARVSSMKVETVNKAVYAVTIEEGGFVLVAQDDEVGDILGFSETDVLDCSHAPSNFKSLMDMYEKEAELILTKKIEKANGMSVRKSPIFPLLKSKWDQGSPDGEAYNIACPKIGDEYCITGCAATAMAQLMYYYKYPKKTLDVIPGYESNATVGYLQALEITTFDWDNMQDEYAGDDLTDVNSPSALAVSKLMKYCGYVAKMDYGLDWSAGWWKSDDMVKYFGYNPYSGWIQRNNFSIKEWNEILYGELDAGRPIIYTGDSKKSGHYFILDGYNDGLYHINWGWGGYCNGYYMIDLMDNDRMDNDYYKYSMGHQALVGVCPEETKLETVAPVGTYSLSINYDNNYETSFDLINNSSSSTYYYGVGAVDSSEEITALNYYEQTMDNGWWTSVSLSGSYITDKLSDGKYKLTGIYSKDGISWHLASGADRMYVDLTISNGKIQSFVSHPQAANMKIVSATLGYFDGGTQQIEVIFENLSKEDYQGIVGMCLSDKDDYTDISGVYVPSGSSSKVYFYYNPDEMDVKSLIFYEYSQNRETKIDKIGEVALARIAPDGKMSAEISSRDAFVINGMNYVLLNDYMFSTIDVRNGTSTDMKGYVTYELKSKNDLDWDYNRELEIKAQSIYRFSKYWWSLKAGETYTYNVYFSPDKYRPDPNNLIGSFTFTVSDGHFPLKGDVNGDYTVDISDIVAIINTIAKGESNNKRSDVNTDGKTDISDIVNVINIIAGVDGDNQNDDFLSNLSCSDSNHPHAIDLGIGVKFACCNVGASAPWEYGGYYAWGETEEKVYYEHNTYKYYNSSTDEYQSLGRDIAGTQYDVARVKWGGGWHMPSHDQLELLCNKCSSEWGSVNGVKGRKFTGPNGVSIFLPAAGDNTGNVGDGCYWSSTWSPYYGRTYDFFFDNSDVYWSTPLRCYGLSVRPVTE